MKLFNIVRKYRNEMPLYYCYNGSWSVDAVDGVRVSKVRAEQLVRFLQDDDLSIIPAIEEPK